MIITFGVHNGKEIERVEDGYLAWMVKADRGDFKVRAPGARPFKIPAEEAQAAREELKKRGYRFVGSRIERAKPDDEY